MRIGIVSPTPAMAERLRAVVHRDSRREVTWVANSVAAIDRSTADATDLLILDLHRHSIDAVEATKRIMTTSPCPILLVTDCLRSNAAIVFEAVGAGALDAVELPDLAAHPMDGAPLLAKIEVLSRLIPARPAAANVVAQRGDGPTLIAIGASAGGPAAVRALLAALPMDLPATVVIVQHVSEQFMPGMLRWLDEQSQQRVVPAEDGLRPLRGQVLMAGGSGHLTLTEDGRFKYSLEPRQCAYQPSIDVFFESVAKHWRGPAIGVLLTGMGRDGASGLKKMRESGHHTIAQDEATSAVYGMPKAAASIGAAAEILPITAIADRLIDKVTETASPAIPQP